MLYFPFQAKEEIELKKDCLQVQFNAKEKKKRDDERAAVNMRRAGGG